MQVDILERVSAFTSLGIRFWDAALDRPVAERLSVSARPLQNPAARAVRAFRTLSGVGGQGRSRADRGAAGT